MSCAQLGTENGTWHMERIRVSDFLYVSFIQMAHTKQIVQESNDYAKSSGSIIYICLRYNVNIYI